MYENADDITYVYIIYFLRTDAILGIISISKFKKYNDLITISRNVCVECFNSSQRNRHKIKKIIAESLMQADVLWCCTSFEKKYEHKVQIYLECSVSVLSLELVPPPPLPQRMYTPPPHPNQKGGAYSPAGEAVWGSQFGRLEKNSSTLSTL